MTRRRAATGTTTFAVNSLRFESGRHIEIGEQEGRWRIGSDPTVDIRILDHTVLPHHCILERRAGGVLTFEAADGALVRIDDKIQTRGFIRVGSEFVVGDCVVFAEHERNQGAGMIGQSAPFRAVVDRAMKIASLDCSVLILGETGTGKEVLAKAIHEASPRCNAPFVAINCGAIPRDLLASELFGHEKGAFTGAVSDQQGVFAQAHGGTLFLDEIGELPLDQQAHLLRVLETRRVKPVGSSREISVDVRILAATHKSENLGQESASLRLDIYHRLATVVISLPPLRERASDIGLLVYAMLENLAGSAPVKQPSVTALRALANYHWPGNIRELKHACARAVALGGTCLEAEDFLPDIAEIQSKPYNLLAAESNAAGLSPYEEVMRQAMSKALVRKGTIRGAARELGMPKSTFADRARTFGLISARDTTERKSS
jgi:DNA-binding NtrC family response regulator